MKHTINLNNLNFPFVNQLSSQHTSWMFFLRTIGIGHCLFSLYRPFIASKDMSPQRTIFCTEKINLYILSLRYFLSYLETGRFLRNLKVNLSKIIGIDGFGLLLRVWRYFCPQLSRAKEDGTQTSVFVHEINMGNIEWHTVKFRK